MSTPKKFDVIELARELIRCESVTPLEAGALGVLENALKPLGFRCERLNFGKEPGNQVENLYARVGKNPPNLCFAGHTDVVPVGDLTAWNKEPFSGQVADGVLYGRGAADMKGAIAAFVAASDRFLSDRAFEFQGSISFLITGDEEGPAINGTAKVIDWLRIKEERIDHCLVGEPTNPDHLGEMIKIGRRGSLTASLTVHGTQGHVAYPTLANNPIPRLMNVLNELSKLKLDEGDEYFSPSHLEVTTIDVGNSASNVIPSSASATFNIRFNTKQTAQGLVDWIERVCRPVGEHELFFNINAEPFVTQPGVFSDLITKAIQDVTGRTPELSTTGGTSDARFIQSFCPVVEFGLIGRTMHKVDENVEVAEIEMLTDVYYQILIDYFS